MSSPSASSAGREDPAWDLLRLCSRSDAPEACRETILDLVDRSPDWSEFGRAVSAHGVSGLVYRTFSDLPEAPIPEAVRRSLREQSVAVARANLGLTACLEGLLDLFQAEEVPVLPIKGPVLAVRAYGDLSLRTFTDLDLLVREQDRQKARDVLRRAELSPLPSLATLSDRLLFRWSNEEPFLTPDGTLVELHWGLSSPAWRIQLGCDGFWSRATKREWLGRQVLGLSAEDQLHHLCTHGCQHAWSRLVWVCDVAETIRSEVIDWPSLVSRAMDTGTRRMLYLGVGLAAELLDAPLPTQVQRRIGADPRLEGLISRATRVLRGEGVPAREEFLFQARTRDKFLDQVGFLWGSLTSPTLMDLSGAETGLSVFGRRLKRPFRLFRKYRHLRRRPDGWGQDRS